jgi:NAD(P)-dependent dehydrogenase (short-subunit alcohol dehydrogenase family)
MIINQIESKYNKIDVLINNAAILPRKRTISKDGREMQFAVNYLAPFYLTNKLMPLLEKSDGGRVVNIAGDIYRLIKLDLNNLEGEKGYGKAGWDQYAQTKLLNMLFSYELAKRLEGKNVTSNCLHPGVIRTSLGRDLKIFRFFNLFLTSPSKGARTSIYLATSEEVKGITGKYFIKSKQKKSTAITYDEEIAGKLWEMTETILGINFES